MTHMSLFYTRTFQTKERNPKCQIGRYEAGHEPGKMQNKATICEFIFPIKVE